jgi:hypothetical protein
MPNRIEAGHAKASQQPPGGYIHCACSRLYLVENRRDVFAATGLFTSKLFGGPHFAGTNVKLSGYDDATGIDGSFDPSGFTKRQFPSAILTRNLNTAD